MINCTASAPFLFQGSYSLIIKQSWCCWLGWSISHPQHFSFLNHLIPSLTTSIKTCKAFLFHCPSLRWNGYRIWPRKTRFTSNMLVMVAKSMLVLICWTGITKKHTPLTDSTAVFGMVSFYFKITVWIYILIEFIFRLYQLLRDTTNFSKLCVFLHVECQVTERVSVDIPFRITRNPQTKEIETRRMKKDYRIVYDKRVIVEFLAVLQCLRFPTILVLTKWCAM